MNDEQAKKRRKERIASGFELIGIALVVVGIALWAPPVALIVAGLGCFVIAHPIPRWWDR
ncbi:MAG: hypothetical protein J0I33_00080 [Microbacterium ginsengisoli]|uniref:hypothetical protein n=1 Tax=Microbacterium TaxID=33882 RepID=UPI0006FDBBA3|nr:MULTISPECIES: hypothetical protein [unclassified Microbacterium]KQR91296.1 hypothetical protein ASF93_08085 [Microbacterium sp. Leaf347]KQS01284.1 hypothetical protein ASG00_10915 [Microbacterium sp. Leaf351]MBN9197030.1 hypothetical protein [Microbacterium ginsengisoli]OJU76988.1 MAG: hypothetical protein BGO15_05650 [Microbacterium sp. 71-23]